jgi:hypothetical protein
LSDRQALFLQRDAYVESVRLGQFCSYACLAQYVDERELADERAEPPE